MTIAEKLAKINTNIDNLIQINAQINKILYGESETDTQDLIKNINQAISDFSTIKQSIISAGGSIDNNVPTSAYAAKIQALGTTSEDEFWKSFQQEGKTVNYTASFGSAWNATIFKPKYDMQPTTATFMFYSSRMAIDLVEHLLNLGVTLDFSKSTNMNSTFYSSYFTHIGVVDLTSAAGQVAAIFSYCPYLHTIDKVIFRDKSVGTSNYDQGMFNNCTKLREVRFEGHTIRGLNVQWSPLSLESAKSLVNALPEGGDFTYGVTFSSTTKELIAADKAAGNSDLEAEVYSKGYNYY